MKVGKTTCTCGDGCNCGCGYRPGYHLLRWVLGLFILFFVFAVGVKVGEFLTELRTYMSYDRDHSGMMMDQEMHGYNPGGPMIPATGDMDMESSTPDGQ
jgi:hypothetical protein